jgi:FkbM family methyltransferase
MTSALLSFTAWVASRMPIGARGAMYRFKPLAGFLRSALNRAAPVGLTEVVIAAGGLAGVSMSLDLQSEKDYWLGTYEPELQAAIKKLVQPGMVVFDVGANIGYVSLLFARQVGKSGKVFAFEALSSNLERLRENIRLSGFSSAVEVVAAAVVEGERAVRFLVGPSGGMGKAEGSAGRQEFSYTETQQATGISLDAFVYRMGKPVPQVVKMDIEGGETLALPGMRRLLAEAQPLVFLELHGPEAAKVAWEELKNASYRLCQMRADFPEIKSLEELNWKAYAVAFRG